MDLLFAGGGELGALMRGVDWGKTPLGPVNRWPQASELVFASSTNNQATNQESDDKISHFALLSCILNQPKCGVRAFASEQAILLSFEIVIIHKKDFQLFTHLRGRSFSFLTFAYLWVGFSHSD